MLRMSGPKNANARDSAAMRWPSRQITASEIAGASWRAAMARARSANTSPSAPSATCASVSGWPACNKVAGDLAIMEIAQAAEQRGIDLGGRRLRAVHPGEHLLVGNLEPGLVLIELGVAQFRDMRVGEAAEHQVHLANAAMPGAEQQPLAARVQSIARNLGSGHHLPLQRQKPGRGRAGFI